MKTFLCLTGSAIALTGSTFASDTVTLKETDETLTLSRGEIPVLVYHKADVLPPSGVDPVFTRSGFVYPLHAPSG
ncbi:MAG: hypothetical protein KDL87_14435, partial [Verrucomicrobiae bacterium]|nr:hypothetical protein [Verrucomicrobiae bacterium]